ncbi:MAG: response regulator [Cypionkella sp.]
MTALRILIVEDEALIAFMLEDAVTEAGHVVAATIGNITDAMAFAVSGEFDAALLDMNLNGQKAHALPVTLTARGKPFAFVTGYGDAGVLEQFADAPLVRKPFQASEVVEALAQLAARAGPG